MSLRQTTIGAASLLLGCSAFAACSDSKSSVDAQIILLDAAVDAAPDALTCAPLTACAGSCIDTTSDPDNCGGCGTTCTSGKVCTASACACPAAFAPAAVAATGNDRVLTDPNSPGVYAAASPFSDGSNINISVVGYSTTTLLNNEYTLSGTNPGTPPFFALGYKLNLSTFTPAASFYATAGKLTFTKACAQGASGTLTAATFQAVTSIQNPTIDPNGCSFTVPSMTFSSGKPELCPPTP